MTFPIYPIPTSVTDPLTDEPIVPEEADDLLARGDNAGGCCGGACCG